MSDPFADGLAVLHGSKLGIDAVYLAAAGGDPQNLRVIRSQPSEINGGQILDVDSVSIRALDVSVPARDDQVQLLGAVSVAGLPHSDPVFRISGDPLLDAEGLSWTCAIALL